LHAQQNARLLTVLALSAALAVPIASYLT
jgi:hypothetical protein